MQSVQSDYFTNRQNRPSNLCSFAISAKISKKIGKILSIRLSVLLKTNDKQIAKKKTRITVPKTACSKPPPKKLVFVLRIEKRRLPFIPPTTSLILRVGKSMSRNRAKQPQIDARIQSFCVRVTDRTPSISAQKRLKKIQKREKDVGERYFLRKIFSAERRRRAEHPRRNHPQTTCTRSGGYVFRNVRRTSRVPESNAVH